MLISNKKAIMAGLKGQKDLNKCPSMVLYVTTVKNQSPSGPWKHLDLSIYAKTKTEVASHCKGRSPSKNTQVPNVPSPAVD